MYTAKIENSSGEVLTLTQNEECWQVISITGLNPPQATINITNIAGMDGGKFNSSKLNVRNLVITLKINGDADKNRQRLYNFFRTKDPCIFYFTNSSRDVEIQGYVESAECNIFSSSETLQISILCLYPYFRSVAELIADISHEMAAFAFPFTINIEEPIPFSTFDVERQVNIYNPTDVETGALIQIDAMASVNTITIVNTGTLEKMTLNGELAPGDKILIDTNRGQKSITRISDGEKTNIFSWMEKGSTFFQLRPGSNTFTYSADDGARDADVFVTFAYATLYRGV